MRTRADFYQTEIISQVAEPYRKLWEIDCFGRWLFGFALELDRPIPEA